MLKQLKQRKLTNKELQDLAESGALFKTTDPALCCFCAKPFSPQEKDYFDRRDALEKENQQREKEIRRAVGPKAPPEALLLGDSLRVCLRCAVKNWREYTKKATRLPSVAEARRQAEEREQKLWLGYVSEVTKVVIDGMKDARRIFTKALKGKDALRAELRRDFGAKTTDMIMGFVELGFEHYRCGPGAYKTASLILPSGKRVKCQTTEPR